MVRWVLWGGVEGAWGYIPDLVEKSTEEEETRGSKDKARVLTNRHRYANTVLFVIQG